ncbi:MAG: DUF6268 family outer membrane beta-barrel protein [Planctomycetota bacterium]|nr:DUF6268 family outer membrane beta-barrel protein [Planctomycetota bacterium]
MKCLLLLLPLIFLPVQIAAAEFDSKLDFFFTHQFNTNIDNGGEIGVTRGGFELRSSKKMTEQDSMKFKFKVERDDYDFGGVAGIGLQNPWSTIDTVDFAISWFHSIDQEKTLFAAGLVRSSYEHDFSDGLVGGGSAGFIQRYSPTFTLGFGAGILGQVHDDPYVFPVIVLDWEISENLRISSDLVSRFGSQTGAELVWTPNSEWTIGVGISYDYSRFRLNDSGIAPNGAGEATSWPLSFRATRHVSPDFDLTFYGGVVYNGELRLFDQSRNQLSLDKYDEAGVIGIMGQIRF